MLQQWKDVLIDSGAQFSDDTLVSFDDTNKTNNTLQQGDVMCDLSQVGIIRVTGDDATDFLQNQLTNDINLVTESKGQLSAWCNPKGRTIATFIIHKRQDAYYLTLSKDLMGYVLKRLSMYVMRSKVVLEDVTESLVHFGFAGSPATLECLSSANDWKLNSENYSSVIDGNVSIIKIPSPAGENASSRYEVIGELEDATRLWNSLRAYAQPVNSDTWSYLNIASGLPVVSADSQEAWIPQMLNLQIIDGVSFKKGCFPGQEIVARLKYLGKNKRRAFRLELDTDTLPTVGELIVAEGESAEAGKVLNAALNPEGKVEVLAVLKIAMADKPLSLGDVTGPSAKVLELPFSVDEE